MRLIPPRGEILEPILEYRRRPPPNREPRQPHRLPLKLQIRLLEMIQIQVTIAPGPDELPGLEIALLRHHMGQQAVRRDIERHAEEHVRASLVELTRKPAIRDVELEERMTRRQQIGRAHV